jgi:cytochrome P450
VKAAIPDLPFAAFHVTCELLQGVSIALQRYCCCQHLALGRHHSFGRGFADASLIPSAVEELLRYESPSQHTARLAPEDVEMGGKHIRKRQAVIAVMGAANRDPERFPEPDRLDIDRKDNRHVAFGWAAHFCFGAHLARLEGQIAFATVLRRLPNLALDTAAPLRWRDNLGLRGLTALPVLFDQPQRAMNDGSKRES